MKLKSCVILMLVVALAACAGRMPSQHRSERVLQKYFKKYGKKYPTTNFNKGIDRVEVYSTNEIQYLLVAINAVVFTKTGSAERVDATLKRSAGGWHVVSWENAD